MAEPASRLRDLVAATKPRPRDDADASLPPWTRPNLAGRLVELSGGFDSAALTAATSLVLDAQRRGETTAWVTSRASSFFPPDVAANGVDLEALPVVRVPLPEHVTRAAERLVRCGAFDLVVIDVGKTSVPLPLVTRLQGLAEKHDAAVVFLTEKGAQAPSISSLVSLRAEARRTRTLRKVGKQEEEGNDSSPALSLPPRLLIQPLEGLNEEARRQGQDQGDDSPPSLVSSYFPAFLSEAAFVVEVAALRDKRRPAGWTHAETFDGPPGVR